MAQPDLFGAKPATRDQTSIELILHIHKGSTDKAWLLSKTGMDRDAKFVPRTVAVHHPATANRFTIPRHIALEKGFL